MMNSEKNRSIKSFGFPRIVVTDSSGGSLSSINLISFSATNGSILTQRKNI